MSSRRTREGPRAAAHVWKEFTAASGRKYYYNETTKVTTWGARRDEGVRSCRRRFHVCCRGATARPARCPCPMAPTLREHAPKASAACACRVGDGRG